MNTIAGARPSRPGIQLSQLPRAVHSLNMIGMYVQ